MVKPPVMDPIINDILEPFVKNPIIPPTNTMKPYGNEKQKEYVMIW
eukprot:CAMPEP_0114667554 /NCGR_PEP_ID=MMETSP0191-20121206/34679_1 /TAXON_ID=126664 /ORGANISM="Sorites sp." /LENGTH=45 /DNA_ID= /DNA_START= /DNA_END= /DNA_ORIENTATION=